MIRRPAVISRPVMLGFASSVALFAALAPGANAAVSRSTTCDEIQGETLALNEQWRVVVVGPRVEEGGPRPLVSCDRTKPGPASVRLLASTANLGAYGESVTQVRGFAGDLLVLGSATESSGGSNENRRLIDLRHGSVRSLGSGGWTATPTYSPLFTALGANGSLATTSWSGSDTPGSGGPIVAVGAAGVAITTPPVHELVPSQSGAYYRTASGETGRLDLPGPVAAAEFVTDRNLRTKRMALPRKARKDGVTRTPLPSSARWDTQFELVRERKRRGRGAVYVTISVAGAPAGEHLRFDLVPGSGPELNVLAVGPNSLLVAARFADAPGERRIRLLRGPGSPSPQIDLPSTPSAELPGHATIASDDTLAIADGDQLRLWGTINGTRSIAGVHDLASSEGSQRTSLYYTDGAGKAASIPLSGWPHSGPWGPKA